RGGTAPGIDMTLDRGRLGALLGDEERCFREAHPRSLALFERARHSLLGGVPMHWMVRWAGGFPLFVTAGEGAHLTDVDGHRYLDLCLGDTGAMTGHAPAPTVEAVRAQAGRALTNVGIVHPEPGFHAALRELTRRAGTLLIIDETHTICTGPGGYTRAHGLDPDILTLGKPVPGGVPGAVYGLSEAVADRVRAH